MPSSSGQNWVSFLFFLTLFQVEILQFLALPLVIKSIGIAGNSTVGNMCHFRKSFNGANRCNKQQSSQEQDIYFYQFVLGTVTFGDVSFQRSSVVSVGHVNNKFSWLFLNLTPRHVSLARHISIHNRKMQ